MVFLHSIHCYAFLFTLLIMGKIHYTYPNTVENTNAGIEVHTLQELQEAEIELLQQAHLNDVAPCEAWTALGTNAQISYSTHGIFRYFGKFPSTIATHLIFQYTTEGDVVLDPMAGSGTTCLECLLANRECHSYDINPLSVLLAKVKTTYIEKRKLDEAIDEIEKNYKPMTVEEYGFIPTGVKNLDHWFLSETQDSLRGLLFLINKIKDVDVKDFMTICLCSIIRTVSRATSQQGRLFLDVVTAKPDCLESFIKKAKKAAERVAGLPVPHVTLDIALHSAEDPTPSIQADLTILHPPYFNAYKYSSVNSLELAWLGVDQAAVRKKEVREFFKIGKPEKVEFYLDDMVNVLNSVTESMKPGGVMGLMIGDTVIKGEYIPVTRRLIDRYLMANPNVTVEKVVLRVPKFTEASWTTSQRRTSEKVGVSLNDFIIVFRKQA